jgi:hypothetical protein
MTGKIQDPFFYINKFKNQFQENYWMMINKHIEFGLNDSGKVNIIKLDIHNQNPNIIYLSVPSQI